MDEFEELTPEQKFAAEDAETMVPRMLMQGYSRQRIVIELVRLDWTAQAAHALITRVQDDLKRFYASPESRRKLVSDARKQMWGGLLMALLGVLVGLFTLITWAMGVAPFVVFFGLIGVGLALFARGFQRSRLYGGDRLPFENDEARDEEP